MTWRNLRSQKMNIPTEMQTQEEKNQEEHQEFSLTDLELQWMGMCNRMPQQYSGLAARMKNMNPTILQMPAIEVVVPNEIIKTEMETILRKMQATLRKYLHNSDITLSLRVAEQQEREKILTRREQLELMNDENPSVIEAFDLQLA